MNSTRNVEEPLFKAARGVASAGEGMTPELSILICCHNEEQKIASCIKSLRLAENPSWEAVVVNDASTDKSRAILDFLSYKLSNLRCCHLDYNVGLGDARNYALLQAKGEYICFLDGNDYVIAEELRNNLQLAQEESADIVVAPHLRMELSGMNYISTYQGEFAGDGAFALYLARFFGSWSACFSVMKRRMVIEASCYFSHRLLYEDVAFCMRAFSAVKNGVSSQFAHYVYDRTDESITRSRKPSFFHALSSAKLYYDICIYVADKPSTKVIGNAFGRACKIMANDHYPKIRQVVLEEFHKQAPHVQKRFLRYIRCYDSPFSRSVLALISS